MTKEELRQRILAVVNERRRVSDVDIWRAYTPSFLPWDAMTQELIALAREQKVRREVIAPGNVVIHTIEPSKHRQTSKNPASKKSGQCSSTNRKHLAKK